MKTCSKGSMVKIKVSFFFLLLLSTGKIYAQHQSYILDKVMHHLRIGSTPEWSDFKGLPEKKLLIQFNARQNKTEYTLGLRQEDVKQTWNVRLNGNDLGKLTQDEASMVVYWSIRPGLLIEGQNTLEIGQED